MFIFVETPRGKTVSLKVEGSDTFDIVNAKLRAIKGILPADSCHLEYTYYTNDDLEPYKEPLEPGFFKLSIRRLATGDTFTVFLSKYHDINDLRQMISTEEGFPPFRQTLFYTGTKLDNKKSTLASYNICGESTIDLFVDRGGPWKLSIETLSGKTISLDVFRNYRISKIKAMIQEKEGIHSERQKLAYAGEQLDDHLTLEGYCIQDPSTLLLILVDDDDTLITKERELLIHIFIEATEKTIDLNVKSSATVCSVKAMIQYEEDIPAHQQTLFLPMKQLKDDGLTLDQYYIPNNSTLHLVQAVELHEGKDPGEGNLAGLIPCSNLKRKCPEPGSHPI